MKKIFLILLALFIVSCANIGFLSSEDRLSEDFVKKIETIQSIYRDGLKSEALNRLNAINNKDLKNVEKAKKYNFMGIIRFSNDNIQGAISEFEKANNFKHGNTELKNQILLNLASSFYKIEQFEYSKNYSKQIDIDAFKTEEGRKYARLKLALSQKFSKNIETIEAIFYLGKDLETFNDVKQFDYLSLLKSSFNKISESQKIYLLEENTDNVLAAFLAKEEAFRRMIVGDKDGMSDIIDWLDSKFSHIEDVRSIIEDYRSNLKNYTKIDSKAIGIILPLKDSRKKRFAKKVLMGVETALNDKEIKSKNYSLYIKDSFDNPSASSKAVRELILNHNVSVIIGGLYSSNAKAQYLEARKYGVLFISLSSVNLARSEKGPLLIEIPGSIQSEVYALSNPNFLNKFGKKVALLYPDDPRGNIYANELWNLHEEKVLEITTVANFKPEIKDFRSPVKSLLSLKYPRQRSEELKILKEINELEDRKSSVRRRQNLPPIIDFDWVFIPTYPNNAIQVLPTFSFLEAKNLNFFGTPSWATSRQLMKEQSGWGNINLIGNNTSSYNMSYKDFFQSRNNKRLGLLEIKGLESLLIASRLMSAKTYSDRGEFSNIILGQQQFSAISGKWYLKNNLWIKEMEYLNLKRSGLSKIDLN